MQVEIDGYAVQVDDEDAHWFDRRAWKALEPTPGKIYFRWDSRRNGKPYSIYLHRVIMDAPKGVLVDHRSGDTLDCQRVNLRLGDHLLNARNAIKIKNRPTTSRFKGVHWRKRERRWVARICYSERQHHLGYFDDEVAAAFAYDVASVRFHGEQGRTNFLPLARI
jgi:hypothetical protein